MTISHKIDLRFLIGKVDFSPKPAALLLDKGEMLQVNFFYKNPLHAGQHAAAASKRRQQTNGRHQTAAAAPFLPHQSEFWRREVEVDAGAVVTGEADGAVCLCSVRFRRSMWKGRSHYPSPTLRPSRSSSPDLTKF